MKDGESIPEQKSRVTAVYSSNWRRTAIAIVIIALTAGTGGYLLGARNKQLVFPPQPRTTITQSLPITTQQPTSPSLDGSQPVPLQSPTSSPIHQTGSTILGPSYPKTYIDTNCGYSFRYPAFASLKSVGKGAECPGGSNWISLAFKIGPSSNPDSAKVLPHGLSMGFRHALNRKNETLSDFLKDAGEPDGCCVIDLSTVKPITVNNLRGYVGFVPDFRAQEYYFSLKRNSSFLIIGIAEGSDSQLVNEIIGSLQGVD